MSTPSEPAFRVGDARRAGASRRSIDHADLERPFTGLRTARTLRTDPDDRHPLEAHREGALLAASHFAAHMHVGEFFSHLTAAILWDLPLPGVPLMPIDVAVRAPGHAPRGRGVRGHQLAPAQVITTVHPLLGLRVTMPASTWAQVGGVVRHPYDLTALADALLRAPRVAGPHGRIIREPWATVEELAAELQLGRRIGIAALRESLRLARPGSSSRMETWTRLTIVDAGLPEPVLDHDVYDDSGIFVGCVDLAYPGRQVAIEYEGDQHRVDPKQWTRDIEKYERLAELGWRVIRVTRTMLFERPGDVVDRVRSALRRRA